MNSGFTCYSEVGCGAWWAIRFVAPNVSRFSHPKPPCDSKEPPERRIPVLTLFHYIVLLGQGQLSHINQVPVSLVSNVRHDTQGPREEGAKAEPVFRSPVNGREAETHARTGDQPGGSDAKPPIPPADSTRFQQMSPYLSHPHSPHLVSYLHPLQPQLPLAFLSDLGFCHFFGSDFTSDC